MLPTIVLTFFLPIILFPFWSTLYNNSDFPFLLQWLNCNEYFLISEEELEELFGKFGTVSEVHIVVDKDTKRSKGIAYILYTLPEFAARYVSVTESLS